MSDDVALEQEGPIMLCATKVLKSQPVRIGRIVGNVTLPRTVELRVAVAGAFGGFTLLMLCVILLGPSLRVVVMSFAIGSALGVAAMTYSPLSGESLLSWIFLEASSKRGRVKHRGELVKVYVGTQPIGRVAGGRTIMFPGAVNVPEGSVNERCWRDPNFIQPVPGPTRSYRKIDRAPMSTLKATTKELSTVPVAPTFTSQTRSRLRSDKLTNSDKPTKTGKSGMFKKKKNTNSLEKQK
jgi:hypothetical protein